MSRATPHATMRVLEGHGHSCLIAPDMDLSEVLNHWTGDHERATETQRHEDRTFTMAHDDVLNAAHRHASAFLRDVANRHVGGTATVASCWRHSADHCPSPRPIPWR